MVNKPKIASSKIIYLISSIMSANNFNKGDRLRRELKHLPGPAGLLAFIHHFLPNPLVTRDLDAVLVSPVITVPQKQPKGGEGRKEWVACKS